MFMGLNFALLHAVACLLVVQTSAAIRAHREPFGLEESISGVYKPKSVGISWKSDSELLFVTDSLEYVDVKTGGSGMLVPKEILSVFDPIKLDISGDSSFVLLGYDGEQVIGNAAVARYIAYNVNERTAINIGGGQHLQLAMWGPDNRLAYVLNNDIYCLSEPGATPVQVTTDGARGAVYNGFIDEYGQLEESVSQTVGKSVKLKWSPDGRQIAFGQYNSSAVRHTTLDFYGSPADEQSQYKDVWYIRYSKPGTPIATVSLKVATLPSTTSSAVSIQELAAPVDVVGHEHSLGHMVWTHDNILMTSWKNRVRNISQTVYYNTSENVERLYGWKGLKLERKHGWVDDQQWFLGYGNPSTYLIIDWVPQGEAGSFLHIVKVTGTSKTAITSGEFTVTDIYGWNDNYTIYYQATEKGQSSRRQVYAVQEGCSPRCLSCDVITPEGNDCQRASAEFSHNTSWFIFTCLGPDVPVISLHSTANFRGNQFEMVNNSALREALFHKQMPQRLDDWVDVGEGMRAQVRMWLPPGLDPQASEKRPAIVHVYAGPNSQEVDDSYQVDIWNYFTTSRRYVVVLIDGRGSGCKGDRMLFSIYRRLGTVEVQDQIDVTKRLTEKYRFIDSSRVAIMGWSYGGYTAAMALARDDENVFRCAVSVAPVVNWMYYNAKFGEQYMGLPKDNPAGYNAGDITRLAERFTNKSFLLIHGTADDNVLYHNSMMLARALEEAGVLFREQTYPGEFHWISRLSTHVYRTIDAFFLECFDDQYLYQSSAVKTTGRLVLLLAAVSVLGHVL